MEPGVGGLAYRSGPAYGSRIVPCHRETGAAERTVIDAELAIARDIGDPLQEARALEGIGQCHLRDGNPGDGTSYLRQALTIYQRIRAPAAQRVQGTLHDHAI
jgi:hypothetical protein